MAKKEWYEAFREKRNVLFTTKDFENYRKGVINDLKYYGKYLTKGLKILDLGCGLGCEAVPLSSLGYNLVGIDNDRRVVQAAKKNGKKFGKKIKIIYGDIFKMDKLFKKNSFGACLSGGVLEHFKQNQVRKLIQLQLKLAPLIIASMPVKTKRTMKSYGFTEQTALNSKINGIYRNFWSENEWVNKVLKGFNLVEHFVVPCDPAIGKFDILYIIIKRKV